MTKAKLELFVPGRLCLFGEHSDWAGQMRKFNSAIVPGQALVACTAEGIHATARISDMLSIRTLAPNGEVVYFEYPFNAVELRCIAAEGGFFSYVAGVASYISTFYEIGGLELDCYNITLPQKKGLSSSAAICTLVARAFNWLYGLNLTIRGEMEAAYHGEQLTPSRCGRLDQVLAYGEGIMHMTFNSDVLDVKPLRVGKPLHFVFADLKAEKDTIVILRDLHAAYPFARTEEHHTLHNLFGGINERIVVAATAAIVEGAPEALGILMKDAQELFDLYAVPLSPIELKAEKLHKVLDDDILQKWVYGGKGVGSQGDGMVQFIAKSEEDQKNLEAYLSSTLGLDAFCLTVPKTRDIRKAVIPVAGYGMRMYPATKVIKKEFLPVVDDDGYTKPALLIIINELLKAGIDKICLIIRPGEEDLYLSLFNSLDEVHLNKLQSNLKSYERKLSAIKNKITFAYQGEMLGFGHAVLQSSAFAENDSVMLLLGDHLYRSNRSTNCAAQLSDAYEKTGKMIIGMFEIPLEDAPKYGVVKGTFVDERLAKLETLKEKPSVQFASEHLGIDGKQYGVYMYILTPRLYKALSQLYKEGMTQFGEFQLTPALEAVVQSEGGYGLVIDGERFDIGLPEKYKETVAKFGR